MKFSGMGAKYKIHGNEEATGHSMDGQFDNVLFVFQLPIPDSIHGCFKKMWLPIKFIILHLFFCVAVVFKINLSEICVSQK